jgi:hypothetical protein
VYLPHPHQNVPASQTFEELTNLPFQHSDQLTYLGPRPIIGSLSLGVTREFRVRRIVPQDDDSSPTPNSNSNPNNKNNPNPDLAGQISLHLPHNSLLVMHADMQEAWKHSVAPTQAIDPHPVAGNARINITSRYYRDGFHPRHTPRCPCGVPAVLRVVTKTRKNWGRYFWMCHAGNVPGKEGCGFFGWVRFDEDGNLVRGGGEKGAEGGWKGEGGLKGNEGEETGRDGDVVIKEEGGDGEMGEQREEVEKAEME